MIIPKLIGVIGLLSLPNEWMVVFIYAITGLYAITWIIKWDINSQITMGRSFIVYLRWLF